MKFDLENFETLEQLEEEIAKCEGVHKQQCAYSSYERGLTQVCFDCQTVRTTINL